MILPSMIPITSVSLRLAVLRKSSGVTTGASTEFRPTGATGRRFAKAASSSRTPPAKTMPARQVASSSSTTMSARLPGAIWPRAFSPKASAAERLAAR